MTAEASREDDLALVRAGIEATNNGDIDALLPPLDPGIEFHIAPGSETPAPTTDTKCGFGGPGPTVPQ